MTAGTARLAFILVLATLATSLEAQPAEKVARIGYLTSHSPETFQVGVFRQGLRDLGWIEGRNLIIDYRSADGKFRLSGLRDSSLSSISRAPRRSD